MITKHMSDFKSHLKSSPPLFTFMGATGFPIMLMGLFLESDHFIKLGMGIGVMGLLFFSSPFIRAFLRKP